MRKSSSARLGRTAESWRSRQPSTARSASSAPITRSACFCLVRGRLTGAGCDDRMVTTKKLLRQIPALGGVKPRLAGRGARRFHAPPEHPMLRGCVHPAAVYAAVLSFAASLTLTGSLPLLHGKVVAPRLAAGRGKLGCQFD